MAGTGAARRSRRILFIESYRQGEALSQVGAPHAVLMRRSLPFYVLEDRGVQLLADIIIANFPRQIPAKFYKKNLP